MNQYRHSLRHRLRLLILLSVLLFVTTDWANAQSPPNDRRLDWGGHLKIRGRIAWQDEDSVYQLVSTDPYYDGVFDARLKGDARLTDRLSLESHYELIVNGGDTRRNNSRLEDILPGLFTSTFTRNRTINDERRFFDLTGIIEQDDTCQCYHRLDRLNLTLTPDWGSLRIGRQAVTWGNGFLFNPMDLLNPFAPTDVERDYKIGDDLIRLQLPEAGPGDLELLYVPRRDPNSNDVKWTNSSIAARYNFTWQNLEWDLIATQHYQDYVIGIGLTGYLKDAAWRLDATHTFLDADTGPPDYLSLVANLDYSWRWRQKNFYGFIEFFYNGLGKDTYTSALADPNIAARIDRGELFTLGTCYLAGTLQMELHPLVNLFLTSINNIEDPSGILQPRIVWDMAANWQLNTGAGILYGRRNSEYGGFPLPGTPYLQRSPDTIYLWVTYFF